MFPLQDKEGYVFTIQEDEITSDFVIIFLSQQVGARWTFLDSPVQEISLQGQISEEDSDGKKILVFISED